jgi:hypothetical protein
MMSHVLADARDHPVMVPYHAHWGRAASLLVEPWPARRQARARLHGAITLALSFDTWRTLSESGLTDRQAVELMLGLARSAAR